MVERAANAEALFEEKERAQVTLNSIGDAVMSTDVRGNVTYLNAVAESMTGWSREEAAGHPLEEVFHIIDATTREAAPNPMALAIRENKTVGLTPNCVLIRRDGVEAAIEDSAAPIHDRRGQVTGAVMVFHDVSTARALSLQNVLSGPARQPHRSAQQNAVERPADPGDGPGPPSPATSSRCCSWTWIASSTSTTPWATPSATACCSPWRSACSLACAARTPSAGRAAMSS